MCGTLLYEAAKIAVLQFKGASRSDGRSGEVAYEKRLVPCFHGDARIVRFPPQIISGAFRTLAEIHKTRSHFLKEIMEIICPNFRFKAFQGMAREGEDHSARTRNPEL